MEVGYRLLLFSCVVSRKETVFNKLLEEAIRLGVPRLEILRTAAEVLFLGGEKAGLDEALARYEKEWRKAHDPFY